MKIDEEIARAREKSKDRTNYSFIEREEHEQIAEWLKELKALKENSISKEAFEKMKSKAYKKGHRQGYNKAIDDFIHECDKFCGYYKCENRNITRETMLKIAERLKAGK